MNTETAEVQYSPEEYKKILSQLSAIDDQSLSSAENYHDYVRSLAGEFWQSNSLRNILRNFGESTLKSCPLGLLRDEIRENGCHILVQGDLLGLLRVGVVF